MAKKKSQIIGRWRITSMTEWDQHFVDEEVPGYFKFCKDGLGDLQFGYVQGQIDWRETERDGRAGVEFTFEGKNEMTPTSGRGWAIMPYYFAGRLESGNVCEYFIMMRYFNEIGITEHDEVLYEMGMKEKEHEVYFQKSLANNRLMPLFEKIFGWGNKSSSNDVDLHNKFPIPESKGYCKHRK